MAGLRDEPESGRKIVSSKKAKPTMSGRDVAMQRLPRNVCGGNIRDCNMRVENAFTGNGDVAVQRLYPNPAAHLYFQAVK